LVSNNYFDSETNELDTTQRADIRDVEDALLVVLVNNYPPEGAIPASVTVFAESLVYNEDVRNGKDYLDYSSGEILEMGNFSIVSEEYGKMNIDGQEFYIMDTRLEVDDKVINQSFVCTTRNKFAISAIMTYSTNEQRMELMDAIKQMKFSN